MAILSINRAVLAAVLAALAAPAGAETLNLPNEAPLPTPRPYAPVDSVATGAIPFAAGVLKREGDLTLLKQGLDALSKGDTAAARRARERLAAGSLDRHIMSWAIAMSDNRDLTSAEIAEAARTLSGWPGMARLRANSERALYRERPAPRDVVAAFGNTRPTTFEGTMALARAHVALGNRQAALAVLVPFWRTERLEGDEETALIREFGQLIPAAEHRRRMERMLYIDRVRSAERVAKLAGGEALTRAWAAVIRNENNARQLLDAVPANQRTAGYIFARARYLRRQQHYGEAAKVILTAPGDEAALIDLDTWWFERRALSRGLLDSGDPQNAYRVVAAQTGGSRATVADAHFHAGWYALRALKDARRAAQHFGQIPQVAEGAISLARAYYWLGRAAEAGGPGSARDYYARAASYGTAFYGQLAAAKLGRNTVSAEYPRPSDAERQRFAARPAVRAIQRLEAAGHERRADMLYRELARELTSAGELALLAVMAEKRGNHYLALVVGKIAAQRGLEVGALSHPVGAIPTNASISGAGKALAYAIARQESEFNVGAVSPAGARGLLQLMPATAQAMARKSGLAYSAPRLTSDASYNATLGAAYLGEQLERFSGSYVLTFVGYNAGPSRATEWIQRYGDPRGASVEQVVDWIERIPFNETRSYVQRVMENYQVYKMRLTGSMDIERDLTRGR